LVRETGGNGIDLAVTRRHKSEIIESFRQGLTVIDRKKALERTRHVTDFV
jgi:hypothetical protein